MTGAVVTVAGGLGSGVIVGVGQDEGFKEALLEHGANDFAEDSRLDRMSWSFDSLRRWERTMKIQHCEWEADKERVVSLFDEKVRILEAREHAILWQERDIVAKELDLNEREECLLAKERGYNSLLQDMQDDAFRFRKEYRYRHKVIN